MKGFRVSPGVSSASAGLFLWFTRQCREARLRSMLEFAEGEVVIPNGPFEGMKFRAGRLPYGRLFFEAVDSGKWRRFAATAPSQSGKTLTCFVIPILYFLFEMKETVILAAPSMDIARDKWRLDLLPVIMRTRYRNLLPTRGAGSKGGSPEALAFGNGAELKFMSGGGDDKKVAAYTSRILVVTEVDGLDRVGGGSAEADRVSQLMARLRGYRMEDVFVFLECTVSVAEGRIWREVKEGTDSRIVLPCPKCGVFVSPEREHFAGWKGAADEIAAREGAYFCCPKCGAEWSEEDRARANGAGRLLHRGQSIDRRGRVRGKAPRTMTLGFRWSAVNNLLRPAADVGWDEWRADRADDEENAEREMCQFVWAIPPKSLTVDLVALNAKSLSKKMDFPVGVVPEGVECLTAAIDVGKYLLHWVALAWKKDGSSWIVDYGVTTVHQDHEGLSEDDAILLALRETKDFLMSRFVPEEGGDPVEPQRVLIDSGAWTDVIYGFCRENAEGRYWRFMPTQGVGATQRRWGGAKGGSMYRAPARKNRTVKHLGTHYHIKWFQDRRAYLLEADSDYWKSWAHERLSEEKGKPGAMVLFKVLNENEHTDFSHQLTNEYQVKEFVAGIGDVIRWVQRGRRKNHYLDALYMCCVGGHFCDVRLLKKEEATRMKDEGRRMKGDLGGAGAAVSRAGVHARVGRRR